MKHQTTTDRVILAVIIAIVFVLYGAVCVIDTIGDWIDWILGLDLDQNKHL